MFTISFQQDKKIHSQGFSLVELMVSLTVFSIVMVASISTLLTLVDANAKAQALYTGMTNLSFAVDSMSRNVRTAYNYYCTTQTLSDSHTTDLPSGRQDCSTGGNTIVFSREKDNKRVAYRLKNNIIEQRMNGEPWLPITASTTRIETFNVTVIGSTVGDVTQPQISLLIKGSVSNGLDVPTSFALQTNVTERILNY